MTGQPLPALPARVLPLNLQRDLPRRILDGQCRQDRRYRAIRLANIQPGDWLWVREPYRLPAALDGIAPSQVALRFDDPEIHFSADGPAPPGFGASRIGYTLPRAFSRMVLCVTARRIAPVQQWTADDARAMGVYRYQYADIWDDQIRRSASLRFMAGKRVQGLWHENPEVTIINFSVLPGNVDDLLDQARAARTAPGNGPARIAPDGAFKALPVSDAGAAPVPHAARGGALRVPASALHTETGDLS